MKFLLTFLFLFQFIFVFAQKKSDYIRYIDSANHYVSSDAQKALQFLDSIPTPLEKYIKGKIGVYYSIKATSFDREKEQAKVYQSYLLAVRFAKEEEDFNTAGDASLGLFSNMYWLKRDTTAYKYLDDARKFYILANNKDGLTEVDQMPAYVKFLERDYKKSNQLILEKLDEYRKIDHDAYYYLFATYMLTSNYIKSDNLEEANTYFAEFKKLETNPTLSPYNYYGYGVSLNLDMAKLFLAKKEIDSTITHLATAGKLQKYMSISGMGSYFTYYADAYKAIGDEEKSNRYLDSLKQFQNKVLDNNIDASLDINKILLNSEETIKKGSEKTRKHQAWLIVLGVVLFLFALVLIFGYKKLKTSVRKLLLQKKDFSQLETKHEKLKVKTQGLENYIAEIKGKVKQIASKEDGTAQKSEMRDLYRTINAETSSLKNDEEKHFEVLKELNESFFEEINKDYPTLGNTETLICYYLKLGFKNKEIAFFLDRSIRGIESQRYRISKKMELENSKILFDYLNTNY